MLRTELPFTCHTETGYQPVIEPCNSRSVSRLPGVLRSCALPRWCGERRHKWAADCATNNPSRKRASFIASAFANISAADSTWLSARRNFQARHALLVCEECTSLQCCKPVAGSLRRETSQLLVLAKSNLRCSFSKLTWVAKNQCSSAKYRPKYSTIYLSAPECSVGII